MSYHELLDGMATPATALECTPAVNHNAVCAVLRWAKRAGADVADVGQVCAALGLDLSGALERARRADRG